MGFLSVNGIALDVEYGSFHEEPIHTGDLFGRTLSGRVAESRGPRSRRWRFRINPLALADAEIVRDLLEGRGQCWNFDSSAHSYSGAGVTNTAAGTFTRSSVSGKYSGKLNVGSGSVFGVDMSNKLGKRRGWSPTDGYTLGMWRATTASDTNLGVAGTWRAMLAIGAVAYTRGVANNPAGVNQYLDGVLNNSTLGMGNFTQVSAVSPYVGIHGYSNAVSTTAVDYDDLFLLPYQLPARSFSPTIAATAIAQLNTFMQSYAMPKLPRVRLFGDALPDAAPGVEAICRVETIDVQQEINGTVQNNTRALQVVAEEF